MNSQSTSSKATGGLGVVFEQKIQASFIMTMLVNGRYPCLPAGAAKSIRPQSGQLRYDAILPEGYAVLERAP
jgi:hypothetical protein